MRRLPTSYLVAIGAGAVITMSLLWLIFTVRVDELNGPQQYPIGAPEPAMAGGWLVGVALIVVVLLFVAAGAFAAGRELVRMTWERNDFDELDEGERERRAHAASLLRRSGG